MLQERRDFACPAGAAHAYLESNFELRQAEVERVRLHVRVPVLGLFALDKDVEILLKPAAVSDAGRRFAMAVSWEPAGGPFPAFSGTLGTEPSGIEGCTMRLSGRYEPPGGPLGAVFDVAFGQRMAKATLRDLLERIGRSAEAEYRRRLRSALP